ncbi:hypothetical protein [uncultured Parasphingorhabdus sp.]|uniref:hypothetical protein n=1 Tax=uncultured Parasphingorhabdus sp. TaxID=2709694 RepID=UPI0030D79880
MSETSRVATPATTRATMPISGAVHRLSRIAISLDTAHYFPLTDEKAMEIAEAQLHCIGFSGNVRTFSRSNGRAVGFFVRNCKRLPR